MHFVGLFMSSLLKMHGPKNKKEKKSFRCSRAIIVEVGKQCDTYSDCAFVAADIQHSMGMRRIVICGLLGSTIFFPTLFHKRHDFRKKHFRTKFVFFLIFSATFV